MSVLVCFLCTFPELVLGTVLVLVRVTKLTSASKCITTDCAMSEASLRSSSLLKCSPNGTSATMPISSSFVAFNSMGYATVLPGLRLLKVPSRNDSMSFGYILRPWTIIRSFNRPAMYTSPLLMYPKSPVLR